MNLTDIDQLLSSVEAIIVLLSGWKLNTSDWCVLDGPAIKLHDHGFDSSAWRDHLNIYVNEQALPWKTSELEQTVPPSDSAELTELLEVSRRGIHVHLVPAARYYQSGFDRGVIRLGSGRSLEAATLRGCSQMWSYKSVEVIDRGDDFGEDLERIVAERQVRLDAAMIAAKEPDVRQRLRLLQRGYEELRNKRVDQARQMFQQAAGKSWIGGARKQPTIDGSGPSARGSR